MNKNVKIASPLSEPERVGYAMKCIAEPAFLVFELKPGTDMKTTVLHCRVLERSRCQVIQISGSTAQPF